MLRVSHLHPYILASVVDTNDLLKSGYRSTNPAFRIFLHRSASRFVSLYSPSIRNVSRIEKQLHSLFMLREQAAVHQDIIREGLRLLVPRFIEDLILEVLERGGTILQSKKLADKFIISSPELERGFVRILLLHSYLMIPCVEINRAQHSSCSCFIKYVLKPRHRARLSRCEKIQFSAIYNHPIF